LELVPDPVIRPLAEILVGPALDVQAADLRRAKGVQREPALVVREDQHVGRGGNRGQNPEPAERVLARVAAEHPGRDRVARDPLEAVAARDEVAPQLVLLPFVAEANARLLGIEAVQADALDLEQQRKTGGEPRLDQILDDLPLPVDRRRASAGQLADRDPVSAAAEAQLDAVLDEALAAQPLVKPQLGEQVDGALLEHAGADALLDVLAVPILKHDRLDPAPVQEVRQQQPRRAAPDDAHLRPHARRV
jgi:hypothetical protein